MNMIIAGDGHTNIQAEDSLSSDASSWSVEKPDCDLILTNPPFGTSENDSLEKEDWEQYTLKLTKGQQLFLQKMVQSTVPDGDICTVIDGGINRRRHSEHCIGAHVAKVFISEMCCPRRGTTPRGDFQA
jgi:type I restriction enzyme M protein